MSEEWRNEEHHIILLPSPSSHLSVVGLGPLLFGSFLAVPFAKWNRMWCVRFLFFFLLCFFLNYKWDGNECVNLKRAKKKRNTHHAWLTPTSFNRCEEWTLSLFSFFWAFCAVMKWNEERTKARAKRPKEKRKRSVNEWAVCFAFAFVQFTHLFRSACNWTKHKGKTRLTSFIPLASWGCVLCLSLFIGFVCNGSTKQANGKKKRQRTQH